MAPQTVVATVVPQGLGAAAGTLRFSIHFSPRLIAPSVIFNNFGDFTGNWPEFYNWPDTVMTALSAHTFVVHQYSGGSPVGVPLALGSAQLRSTPPDGELWKSLFYPQMAISDFTPTIASDRFADATFRSYPLMALHAEHINRWNDLLVHHPTSNVTPAAFLGALGPIANAASLELRSTFDGDIGAAYDRQKSVPFGKVLPSGSRRVGAGSAASPTDARGHDYAQLVHFLAPRTDPEVIKRTPLVPPSLDFHQAIALLGDHPVLLRRLGLVLDFEVSGTVVGTSLGLQAADFPTLSNYLVTPRTAVTASKNLAAPAAGSNLTQDRVADLTRQFNPSDDAHQDGWDLIMLDVEGASIKTLGATVTAQNARTAKGPAAPTTVESPVLRQTGIRLVRSSRAVELANTLRRHDGLLMAADQNANVVYLDDLVRGFRVDIWDDVTHRWHALTRRDMTYLHDLYGTVAAPDSSSTAWFSNEAVVSAATTASADPASTSSDIFVSETFTEWSGWSLAAPRPGKTSPAGGGATPVAQPISRHPELKLTVRSVATPGTLPALRFGRVYAVRLRSADIVGGGPRLTDLGNLVTSGNPTRSIRYGRYEPLPPPELVASAPFVGGDSLTQMVILNRNGVHPQPLVAATARYVMPPAATVGLVENHGGFDGITSAASFSLLSLRDGARLDAGPAPSWMPVKYTMAADTRSDGSAPTVYVATAPSGVQTPIVQPPWLIDPMVGGVRIAGRGVPEVRLDLNPYGAEAWWNGRGWKLVVRPGAAFTPVAASTATPTSRARSLFLDIPAGQMFDAALSSTPQVSQLKHLAAYNQVVNGTATNKATLLADMTVGRSIRVSPPTRMKFVHAVQIPLLEPVFNAPITVVRQAHGTTATFSGVWMADRYSTGRLDTELLWTEPNDTKSTGPAPISGSGHLPPIQITYPEPGTLNSPQAFSGLSFNFGDTKHRLVRLPLTATTRYASYFSRSITGTLRSPTVWTLLETGETGIQPLTERVQAVVTPAAPSAHFANYATLERDVHYTIDYQAGTIKAVDGSTAVGQKVEVTFTPLPISRTTTAAKVLPIHVKSTAPPAAPQVAEVVPVFSDGAWLPYPNATQATGVQRNRNGRVLRVYLERPWFSSGDGELLGVVLKRSATTTAGSYTGVVEGPSVATAPLPSAAQRLTSAWGRDPLVDGVAVAPQLTASSFPLSFAAPLHGKWAVDRQALSLGVNTIVVPHAVQYDTRRKQWFADIAFELGGAYRPFIRLALCRFQPYSLSGMFMSDIVQVDAAQLSPERTLIVTGSGSTRTITLHGHAYQRRATGLMYGETPQSPAAVRSAPVVKVQLQRRPGGANVPSTDPDVGWVDVRAAADMPLSPLTRLGGRQEFVVKNFNVAVAASDQCRIVVREYESETLDNFRPARLGQQPVPLIRMVWADSYRLK